MLHAFLIALLALSTGLFLFKIGVDLLRKRLCTMSLVFPIFFAVFVIPAFVLNLGVHPTFTRFPIYGVVLSSESANDVALAVLTTCTVAWFLVFYRPRDVGSGNFELVVSNKYIRAIATVGLIAPLVMVALAPEPSVYLQYGAILDARFQVDVGEWHFWVAIFVRLAILCAALIFLMGEKLTNKRILYYVMFAFIFCFIGQKRSYVSDALLLLALVLAMRGRLSFFNIGAFLMIGLPALMVLSNLYIEELKGSSQEKVELFSERWLIDFSRYQNVVFVSYEELNGRPIMDRGASMIYNVTFFVPRQIWSEKPYPYAIYYTRAVIGFQTLRLLGWALTTSIIDESIANFGFIGAVFPILFMGFLCLFNDRRLTKLSGATGVMISVFFLIVHFAAFSYMVLLWIGLVITEKRVPRPQPDAFDPVPRAGRLAG